MTSSPKNTSTLTSRTQPTSPASTGLSAGAKAGISISSLIAIIAFIIAFILFRRRNKTAAAELQVASEQGILSPYTNNDRANAMRIPHSPGMQELDTSVTTTISAQSQGAEPGNRTTAGADSTQCHEMAQTKAAPDYLTVGF
ncbi:MAG: hypothetical protein M1840_003493 [Geoglossum simile]|nr:MAG: hypothetical protein M1840_003493 [Geoglossum simile]